MPLDQTNKRAQLFRMSTDEHTCPFGLKAKDLLVREGFTVDDNLLTSRAETDAFKAAHGVKTTPQVFIGGDRIGGYDDVREHLGKRVKDPDAKTYKPVAAIFAMAFGMGLAVS